VDSLVIAHTSSEIFKNYTKGFQFGWDPATGVVETFYMAKLFHLGEFACVNVEEEGNDKYGRKRIQEVYWGDAIFLPLSFFQ
jgi:hypothetical protein